MPNIKILKKLAVFIFSITTVLAAQEQAQKEDPFMLIIPVGYDFVRMEQQTLHNPAAGIGFILGEQDLPFDEVDRSFFGMALYRPLIFTETLYQDVPKYIHQIEAIFDARLKRHQLLFIFKSSSDKPVAGGLNTFQAGAGWGYEVIRRPHVSLILGAALGVSDFGITLPSGAPLPVMPLPLIRFGINTKWLTSSFEFLTGPNLDFAIAPKGKIRLLGDMRMDNYRSIGDLICEYTLLYRFFDAGHKQGDFAGIGVGFKHDSVDFSLSRDFFGAETFELQQTSVFMVLDLTLIKIQGGWIFNSEYLVDGKKSGSPGKGFYISVQGIIPIGIR